MRIPRQRFSHVKCVFFVLCCPPQTKTSIVLFHPSVHTVSEPFVHVDSQVIRASHVEVDEEALIDVVGNEFEQVHHLPCQAETTVLRSDGDRGYMSVMLEAVTLGLSENVTHHATCRSLLDATEIGPSGQIGKVERDSVGFSPNVQVNVIELEEICALKGRRTLMIIADWQKAKGRMEE